MCQEAELFTKPLDVHKFYKYAKTVLNVACCDSNVRAYCERCKLSNEKTIFCEARMNSESKLLNSCTRLDSAAMGVLNVKS